MRITGGAIDMFQIKERTNNGKFSGIPELATQIQGCREEETIFLNVARPLLCSRPPGENGDQHATPRPDSFFGSLIPSTNLRDLTFLLCFGPSLTCEPDEGY